MTSIIFFKCIIRKLQSLHLFNEYGTNIEFAKNIRKFICLAFVPVDTVVANFEMLANQFGDDDANYLYSDFIEYFEKTWIQWYNRARTEFRDPKFPPRIWNVRDSLLTNINRTNNAVEGWNNQLNNYARCSHPHVHKFIEILKQDMTSYRTKIIQIYAGNNINPQRTKYRQHSTNLINIVQRFGDNHAQLIDNIALYLTL